MSQDKPKRNGQLYDRWSIVHLSFGIAMGWLMTPKVAMVLMVLWEPVEIFLISPFLGRFGVVFGYESLPNSLSDIVFDAIGILLSIYVLRMLFAPPFQLF
jgi:hypothetical protein